MSAVRLALPKALRALPPSDQQTVLERLARVETELPDTVSLRQFQRSLEVAVSEVEVRVPPAAVTEYLKLIDAEVRRFGGLPNAHSSAPNQTSRRVARTDTAHTDTRSPHFSRRIRELADELGESPADVQRRLSNLPREAGPEHEEAVHALGLFAAGLTHEQISIIKQMNRKTAANVRLPRRRKPGVAGTKAASALQSIDQLPISASDGRDTVRRGIALFRLLWASCAAVLTTMSRALKGLLRAPSDTVLVGIAVVVVVLALLPVSDDAQPEPTTVPDVLEVLEIPRPLDGSAHSATHPGFRLQVMNPRFTPNNRCIDFARRYVPPTKGRRADPALDVPIRLSYGLDGVTGVQGGDACIATATKDGERVSMWLERRDLHGYGVWVGIGARGEASGRAIIPVAVGARTLLEDPSFRVEMASMAAEANNDPDEDGIPSWLETYIGTDPGLQDSDRDGVDDFEEYFLRQLKPSLPDSDGDGVDDGVELRVGSDPNMNDDMSNLDSDLDTSQCPTFVSLHRWSRPRPDGQGLISVFTPRNPNRTELPGRTEKWHDDGPAAFLVRRAESGLRPLYRTGAMYGLDFPVPVPNAPVASELLGFVVGGDPSPQLESESHTRDWERRLSAEGRFLRLGIFVGGIKLAPDDLWGADSDHDFIAFPPTCGPDNRTTPSLLPTATWESITRPLTATSWSLDDE